MSTYKSVIVKLIIIFLSIILILGLSEIILDCYIKVRPEFKDKLRPFLYDKERLHPYCGLQVPIDYASAKKTDPHEYIVVLTGGSTAFGVGASSPDNTICAKLEKYLNEENKFKDISRFKVVNAANPSYHTTEDKIVLMQFLYSQADMDMFISVDGFNNLARPLENYAYQLPLNYPGWPWIARNDVVCGKASELYYLGQFFEKIRDKNIIKKSKLLYMAINKIVAVLITRGVHNDWQPIIFDRLSKIEDRKKIQIIYESTNFYKEDIIEMQSILNIHNIKALFVLQPLLGFCKDKLSDEERTRIEGRQMYDYGLALQEVWVPGYKKLIEIGQDLKSVGIDFLDFTEIFKRNKERVFMDLMHMNDKGQDIFSKKLAYEIIVRLEKYHTT